MTSSGGRIQRLSSVGSAPTGKNRASMEEGRKRYLDRLEKEAEEIKDTDEWKEKERRAREEAECRIKPEHRSGTKPGSSGGPPRGGSQRTTVIGPHRGVQPDRMRGRGG